MSVVFSESITRAPNFPIEILDLFAAMKSFYFIISKVSSSNQGLRAAIIVKGVFVWFRQEEFCLQTLIVKSRNYKELNYQR